MRKTLQAEQGTATLQSKARRGAARISFPNWRPANSSQIESLEAEKKKLQAQVQDHRALYDSIEKVMLVARWLLCVAPNTAFDRNRAVLMIAFLHAAHCGAASDRGQAHAGRLRTGARLHRHRQALRREERLHERVPRPFDQDAEVNRKR